MNLPPDIQQAIDTFRLGKPLALIDEDEQLTLALPLASCSEETFENFYTESYQPIILCCPQSLASECHIPAKTSLREAFSFSPTPSTKIKDLYQALSCLCTKKTLDWQPNGPLQAIVTHPGGVLQSASPYEAAIDLCQEAGLPPLVLLSCSPHAQDVPRLHIDQLVSHLLSRAPLLKPVASARLPTDFGDFTAHVFASRIDQTEHIALVKDPLPTNSPCLVRMHSECITGDIFSSRRCDCGPQLAKSLQIIAKEGSGMVVYLRGHEGRGIGLTHKLRAYSLQDQGRDTVEANLDLGLPVDKRDYGIGAQILKSFGLTQIRLLTNNPKKYHGLKNYGLEIVERVPLTTTPNKDNLRYLLTKKQKLGHDIELDPKVLETLHAQL